MPIKRRAQFLAFLRVNGRDPDTVTAADKIQWLTTLLPEHPPLTARTIAYLGRCLSEFGPDDDEQRALQKRLVNAYTRHVSQSRTLAPARLPVRRMPLTIFARALAQYKEGEGRLRHQILRARNRALLTLQWRAGLRLRELADARRHWITLRSDGFTITCTGRKPRQNRSIPVASAEDPTLCPVRAMRDWLRILPNDPDTLLFPRIPDSGSPHWHEPLDTVNLQVNIKHMLRKIGAPQYTLGSIKKSFYARAREQLGEAAAFYLSGFAQPETLTAQLRAEPEWAKLRNVFDVR